MASPDDDPTQVTLSASETLWTNGKRSTRETQQIAMVIVVFLVVVVVVVVVVRIRAIIIAPQKKNTTSTDQNVAMIKPSILRMLQLLFN
jgi:hypothetical protein